MDASAQVLLSFSSAYFESTGSQYDENIPMSLEYAKDLIAERCDGLGCNEMDAVYEIFREMIDNLHQYTIPRRLSAVFGNIQSRAMTAAAEAIAQIIDTHWALYQYTGKYKLGEYLREELTLENIETFIGLYCAFIRETEEIISNNFE